MVPSKFGLGDQIWQHILSATSFDCGQKGQSIAATFVIR